MNNYLAVVVLAWPLVGCREGLTPRPEEAHKAVQQAPQVSPAPEAPKPPVAPAHADTSARTMPPGAQRMTEANTLYNQRCALCHGARGLGDGVAAVNLRPQPRSFASEPWQAQTSDAAIMEIIVKGGAAVGRSMMMPPAKDLADQTELLHALVAVVRNFGPGGAKAAPQREPAGTGRR